MYFIGKTRFYKKKGTLLLLYWSRTSSLKNTRAKERAESWKPATKGSFQGRARFMNAWDAVRSTGSAL